LHEISIPPTARLGEPKARVGKGAQGALTGLRAMEFPVLRAMVFPVLRAMAFPVLRAMAFPVLRAMAFPGHYGARHLHPRGVWGIESAHLSVAHLSESRRQHQASPSKGRTFALYAGGRAGMARAHAVGMMDMESNQGMQDGYGIQSRDAGWIWNPIKGCRMDMESNQGMPRAPEPRRPCLGRVPPPPRLPWPSAPPSSIPGDFGWGPAAAALHVHNTTLVHSSRAPLATTSLQPGRRCAPCA
jgi:hypothetical protein